MQIDSTADIFSKGKYYVGSRNSLVNAGRSMLSNSQYSRSQLTDPSIQDNSVKK